VHNYGESSNNIYELRPWLESPKNAIIGHNTPVDWHIIANHGIHCRAFNYDTLVLDWLIDENRENMHGLKQCALDHLKHKRLDYEETFGTPKLKKDGTPYASGAREPISLAEVLEQRGGFEKLVDYACADALDTWLLYELFRPQLEALPWMNSKSMWDYYEQRETKLLEAIIQIERRGLPLDVPFIRLMHEKAVHDQELTEAALLELVGVPMKISSGKQLAALLYGNPDEPQYFERKEEDENQEEGKRRRKKKVDFYLQGLGLPVLRQTEKKAPSTKAEHIAELVRWAEKQDALDLQPDTLDILHHIQAFNGRKTQISTFLEGLPNMARRNGRVHGRIVRTGATSGRFASSQPNLQNLTTGKKDVYHIRDAICAPPGYCLIVADFSQLEYRLLAHFCLHRRMAVSYMDGSSEEIGDIVTQKKTAEIASFDFATGKRVARKITNHFKNGAPIDVARYQGDTDPDSWVVLQHEGDPKRQLVLTEQHNVYIPGGRHCRAGDLKEGDYLLFEEPHFTGDQEQLLIGTALGDSNFKKTKLSQFPGLNYYHCVKQKGYFDWKTKVFGSAVKNTKLTTEGRHSLWRGSLGSSFQLQILEELMAEEYLTEAIIDKMDARALAIWYCDDGCLERDERTANPRKGYCARIACRAWITDAAVVRLNAKFNLDFYRSSGGISVCGPRLEKFFSIIASCVPISMKRKLPKHWQHGAGCYPWDDVISDVTPVRILSASRGLKNRYMRREKARFDITVEGTHNYFAAGVLVSNCQEPKLIELFKQGWDLHAMTCVNIFPHIREEVTERFGGVTTEALDWIAEEYPDERKNAKTLNFELIYGVGYRKLADQLRIPEEEAKRMVNDWFAGYPHVNMWKERVLSTLRTGTPVRTIAGRYRRPVLWRLLHKDRGIRGGEERTLVNAVIQGSAADITNKAMVNILDSVELRELGYAMINQVHDELVGECPIKNYERVVQLLRPLMEHPFEKPLRVPMPVAIGVGHSWANSKV
jgi:DNA polymerase I-like protein with 3'-5' exonuclease and polymerase domains